ncbi:MAG: mechanosensitive ion channel [Chloroflexi bacterium]|nr:mechanosensitive ion channel [Chloroflexota bacterium]
MAIIVRFISGLGLIVVLLALVAVIASEEGVSAVITEESIFQWFIEHGLSILVVVLSAYTIYRVSRLAVPEVVERSVHVRGRGRRAREELAKRSQTLSSILTGVIGIAIGLIAFFMVLAEVGVNIAPLLAGAGVVGIAIGFGAQSLIRDILNGLFILMEDQYNKGDVVKIAGIGGLVEDVNLRRTVLRDLDGIVHTIPNGEVKTASNYTKDWSRVNLNVPVAYGEDLDHVIKVINGVGEELSRDEVFGPMIIGTPKVLRVDNFADSAIEIKVLGETKPLKQWEVTGELRKRLKKTFDLEGIEIPWPHRKLYFGDLPAGKEAVLCETCSQGNPNSNKFCSNCGAKIGQ